jgi:hypothetical protein
MSGRAAAAAHLPRGRWHFSRPIAPFASLGGAYYFVDGVNVILYK